MTEADRIFDTFHKASRIVHLHDARNKKAAQLKSVQLRRCGNCSHWMKSTCKPEKERGGFKSCSSLGCGDFESNQAKLIAEFSAELEDIDADIQRELKEE